MDVINPPAAVQQSDEQQLITTARNANAGIESSKWEIGKAAHEWCERYANGRTDADFARLTGIDADAVTRYRKTFATFGDVSGTYPGLSFSHFRYATSWADAEEWLGQASEHGWSVAMMQRMRSIQDRIDKGDDLTTDSEGEGVTDDDDGTEAASPEHVGDVDPYQKPGTIVVPTPRDKRDGQSAGAVVCGTDGGKRNATGREGNGSTESGKAEATGSEPAAGSRQAAGSAREDRADGGTSLERVLDTVRSLIDALKPTLTGMEPHTLAEQFRRIADEIERDAE